jgi:endonuclease-3
MEALLELPGVGRKTANCVLADAFLNDALAVDTHVPWISNLFILIKTKAPEKTKTELKKIFPQRYWRQINLLLVKLGKISTDICRILCCLTTYRRN